MIRLASRLKSRNAKRLGAAGLGGAIANFVFTLLISQFSLDIHPNVVTTGTVVIVVVTNTVASKYFP
jgi:hypothetical protein